MDYGDLFRFELFSVVINCILNINLIVLVAYIYLITTKPLLNELYLLA